jgi:hypothetical protein
MDLCQNFSREGGNRAGFKPERYTSIDRHEREGKPGRVGTVSTAERNGLMAMMLRLDAAEFETRAIGQLAVSDCGETGRLHALR